jgi:hypothetical protein
MVEEASEIVSNLNRNADPVRVASNSRISFTSAILLRNTSKVEYLVCDMK